MNTSFKDGDLSDYAALVWNGKRIIAAVTLGCVAVMAVLTWALPPIYLIRSVIDTGALAQAEPVETNLLVEAVDRNQFKPGADLFPETMPKGLTVSWRAPSTMILEAKSVDPVDAMRRLDTMTAAVQSELTTRFRRYATWRAGAHRQVVTLQNDANARLRRLGRLFEERSAVAAAGAGAAHAEASTAASQRAAFQLSVEARLRQPLLEIRERWVARQADAASGLATAKDPSVIKALDAVVASIRPDDDAGQPESIYEALERDDTRRDVMDALSSVRASVFAALPTIFRRISTFDLRVARAAELKRSAERQLQLDEQAMLVVRRALPVQGRDAAEALLKALDDLVGTYKEDDPTAARAVTETALRFRELTKAYGDVEIAGEGPSLERVPKILVAPSMPARPIWPRPVVNLAIAFLFGLAASVIYVVSTAPARSGQHT